MDRTARLLAEVAIGVSLLGLIINLFVQQQMRLAAWKQRAEECIQLLGGGVK